MTMLDQKPDAKGFSPQVAHVLNIVGMLGMIYVLLSAYQYQFSQQSLPCTLCLLQRVAMLGVAFGAAMNLMLGARARHYAVSLISAFFGLAVSLRQTMLHINPYWDQTTNMPTLDPNANPPFGAPVAGLSLYVWGIIIFGLTVLFAGIMLLDKRHMKALDNPPAWMVKTAKWSVIILFAVAALETLSTFAECGPFDCPNDGDWNWWLFNL